MVEAKFVVTVNFDPEKFDPKDFVEDLDLEVYKILSYLVNQTDCGMKVTDVTSA